MVIPNQQIRIVSAPLAGMVESMAVAVNQPVKKGQTLARLQSPMLAELQRDFLQAALQSQLAQNSLSRDEKLFKDGIVAESRYLAARNNAATQAAAASEKRQALRLAGMGNAAMAKLQAGQAIDSALEVSGAHRWRGAGADGRAGAAGGCGRALVQGGQTFALVARNTGAAGADRWSRSRAQRCACRLASASGKVISIGRSVAEANQTVMVRAEISDGADNLRPGQYVEAVVGLAVGPKQWSVPNSALVRAENQTYVFVQTPAGYRPQPVQVLGQTAGRGRRSAASCAATSAWR